MLLLQWQQQACKLCFAFLQAKRSFIKGTSAWPFRCKGHQIEDFKCPGLLLPLQSTCPLQEGEAALACVFFSSTSLVRKKKAQAFLVLRTTVALCFFCNGNNNPFLCFAQAFLVLRTTVALCFFCNGNNKPGFPEKALLFSSTGSLFLLRKNKPKRRRRRSRAPQTKNWNCHPKKKRRRRVSLYVEGA